MYYSRSFIASALIGFATATTHLGEMPAAASGASAAASMEASMGVAASETVAATLAASETLAAIGASTVVGEVPAAPTGEAGGMVATHVVQVGGPNGTLRFYPEHVVAAVGDLVQFQFNPKNHSVAQSTFDQPCVPIQNVMANKTDAFYSGFMPAGAAEGQTLTYTIRVTDEKPIWYYCSQGMHCQGGMVGAINAAPSGNKTVESFRALAAAAPENLSPGQQQGQGNAAQPSASAPAGAPEGGAAGTSAVGVPEGGAGAEATGTAGATATGSTVDSPAQQTTNASPGRVSQSFFGLGLGAMAALIAL